MNYETKRIPVDAILDDFRIGEGHEGLPPENHGLASFHYDGQIYFNYAPHIVGCTKVIEPR